MREIETITDEGLVCRNPYEDPHPDLYSYHDDVRERYLNNPQEAKADQEYRAEEEYYKELGYQCPNFKRFGDLKLFHSFEEKFGDDIYVQPEFRMLNDVAFAVVSISSFIDGVRLFTCSGTVIEAKAGSAVILTSASLVAKHKKDDTREVPDNVKINVRFMDGIASAARLIGYCLHYNVAFVEVEKEDPISLPLQGEAIEPIPDVVFALGCHYVSREFMAARGKNILKTNRFNCEELMFSSCKITKCGIGGPLVDSHGYLVGVNFYDDNDTPYLPSFLVSKCWEHINTFGRVRHLYFGGVLKPFRTLKLQEWWFHQRHMIKESLSLLNVCDGLLVEEVEERWMDSPYKSTISKGDIILELFGEPVVAWPLPKYAALLLDKSKIMFEEKIDKVPVRILGQNYQPEVQERTKKQRGSATSTSSQKADPCSNLFINTRELRSCHYNSWPLPQPKWTPWDRDNPGDPFAANALTLKGPLPRTYYPRSTKKM